jgi:hypothetical protein
MQPGLSANFSRREFAAFPLGKALGGPAPTARAVGWVRVDAALFESLSPPFVKGGLCGQKVRLEVVQRAYPGPPFGGRQGNTRSPPPPIPSPPPCATPTPRRPIVVKSGSPQAGPSDASLPVAKSQKTSPHRPAPSATKAGDTILFVHSGASFQAETWHPSREDSHLHDHQVLSPSDHPSGHGRSGCGHMELFC